MRCSCRNREGLGKSDSQDIAGVRTWHGTFMFTHGMARVHTSKLGSFRQAGHVSFMTGFTGIHVSGFVVFTS